MHRPNLISLDRRQLMGAFAAGGASALLPRMARADTTVNWVGWQGYDEPVKAGTFLADNGITLATTYINSNEEIIARLLAGGAGQTDLITIYFGHLPILTGADLLEPIDTSLVPEIENIFPEFMAIDTLRKDGVLYAVPFTWGTLAMVYDPSAIARPVSWRDALKDDVKGKVSMVNDMTGLICTWAPIVTGTKTPSRINIADLRTTLDFLIDIKKNHARTLSSSFGEAVDLFARGEVVTSAIGWDAMVGFAAAKDKALDFVLPEEGAMTTVDTLAIPKGAPNREAAYKVLAQSLSPQGQQVQAEVLTQGVVTTTAAAMASEANRAIFPYDTLSEYLSRAKFYPFWPLEPEGDFVTHDVVQEEYQRFLTA
jgi:spermidine/putrescine-binding protein